MLSRKTVAQKGECTGCNRTYYFSEMVEIAQKEPHTCFLGKNVWQDSTAQDRTVRWLGSIKYEKVNRTVWNREKGRGLAEVVNSALKRLGIRENRGYRIQEQYVGENGIDIYVHRVSDNKPVLGIECKNVSPLTCLTLQEAKRTIKNLEPFEYKLLLFAHRKNIFNINKEIKGLLKSVGIHLDYIDKEIVTWKTYGPLLVKRASAYTTTFGVPSVYYPDDRVIEFVKVRKGTVKEVKRRIFRILYNMGAVALTVYRMEKKGEDIEVKENYWYRIIASRTFVRYFPLPGKGSEYMLIRKGQKFQVNFLSHKVVDLTFTLPIKRCIFRYCKYRLDCKSLPLSFCPRNHRWCPLRCETDNLLQKQTKVSRRWKSRKRSGKRKVRAEATLFDARLADFV